MLFIHQLQNLCATHGDFARVDMALWPQFFALDSLSEINVSKNFGFLQSGTDVGNIVATSEKIMKMIVLVRRASGPKS